eukprot:50817_1
MYMLRTILKRSYSSKPNVSQIIKLNKLNQNKENELKDKDISLWIWPDTYPTTSYPQCFNLMATSFAKPNDIIFSYNKNDIDCDWFDYMLRICKLKSSNFVWMDQIINNDDNNKQIFMKDIINKHEMIEFINNTIDDILDNNNINNIYLKFNNLIVHQLLNNVLIL